MGEETGRTEAERSRKRWERNGEREGQRWEETQKDRWRGEGLRARGGWSRGKSRQDAPSHLASSSADPWARPADLRGARGAGRSLHGLIWSAPSATS